MDIAFEWDPAKDRINKSKHGVSFKEAEDAFYDPMRIILKDVKHSEKEGRLFCYGMVDDDILTVRFTMRGDKVRIFGAAYWREGKDIYEKENYL